MRKFGKLRNPIRAFLIALIVSIGIKIYFSQKDAIKEPKYKVEKGLEGYLKSFVNLADLNGIDLSYIYGQDITIVWEVVINKNSTNVATSFGRDKDKIIIVVNKERFMSRTDEGRKYVMFHELGHDVLNFPHLEHPERGMMEGTAYTGFFRSYERFDKERQEKYLYTSLKKMFDRYHEKQGDGISDSPWDIDVWTAFGYQFVSIANEETLEFYGFIGQKGYHLVGIFRGINVYAIREKKIIKIYDFDDKLIGTIK